MTLFLTDQSISGNPSIPDWNTWLPIPRFFHKERNFLHFPPEAEIMLTSFLYETLNKIYWSAEELSPEPVVSAKVTFYSPPDGEGCDRLNLFLEVDTDWDGIDKLERSIIDKVIEWAQDWSDAEWADYSERTHYVLIPASP